MSLDKVDFDVSELETMVNEYSNKSLLTDGGSWIMDKLLPPILDDLVVNGINELSEYYGDNISGLSNLTNDQKNITNYLENDQSGE